MDRPDNRERQRLDRDQTRPAGQQSSKELSKKDSGSASKSGIGGKHSLASKLGGKMKDSPVIDPNWENWDETNLDYDDELMLEKKRQLLQRELEKQMATDSGAAIDQTVGLVAPGSAAKGQKAPSQLNVHPSTSASGNF